jgi:hypothetical protein
VSHLEETKQKLLRLLPSAFGHDILQALDQPRDIIISSSEPQSGKTKVILILMWLWQFVHGRCPIVVLGELRDDITQFLGDTEDFNRNIDYPDLTLNLLEIKPRTKEEQVIAHAQAGGCLLITIKDQRYKRLLKLIPQIARPVLMYDEADCSVSDGEKTIKEKTFRQIIATAGSDLRVTYITATPFAVENSIVRSENRSFIEIVAPNNLYDSLEFRGFDHPSNEFVFTPCLNQLRTGWSRPESPNSDEEDSEDEEVDEPILNPEAFEELCQHLREIRDHPKCTTQPNIALINIFMINRPKEILADALVHAFGNTMHVVINVGGHLDIRRLNLRNEVVSQIQKKKTIAQFLQHLKDVQSPLPIIIIATRKASRAQRYKSLDHEWKLTHHFLDLPAKAHGESIIQSLRGNGQYAPSAPNLTYYMTPHLKQLIQCMAYNKGRISAAVAMYPQWSPRQVMMYAPVMAVKNKMSRGKLDDTRIPSMTGWHGECATMQQARTELIPWLEAKYGQPVVVMSEYVTIPREMILQRFWEHLDLTQEEPLDCIKDAKVQTDLRQFIVQYCRDVGAWTAESDPTCQVGYRQDRYMHLIKFEETKNSQFRADIIAGDPAFRRDFGVVIFRSRDISVDAIYLWHSPDGTVRYYVKGVQENSIVRLTHLTRD